MGLAATAIRRSSAAVLSQKKYSLAVSVHPMRVAQFRHVIVGQAMSKCCYIMKVISFTAFDGQRVFLHDSVSVENCSLNQQFNQVYVPTKT